MTPTALTSPTHIELPSLGSSLALHPLCLANLLRDPGTRSEIRRGSAGSLGLVQNEHSPKHIRAACLPTNVLRTSKELEEDSAKNRTFTFQRLRVK